MELTADPINNDINTSSYQKSYLLYYKLRYNLEVIKYKICI